jgi:hypothetical protein
MKPVDSTTRDMAIQLRNSKGTKLHITDGSVYNMTDGSHDNYNLLAYYAYHDILVDKGGVLSMDLHNSYSGINLGMLRDPHKYYDNVSACTLCLSCSNVFSDGFGAENDPV